MTSFKRLIIYTSEAAMWKNKAIYIALIEIAKKGELPGQLQLVLQKVLVIRELSTLLIY